ncbi:MAG: AMP-binding protein, partial [Sulfitobacter sp.]|nr:AMP-binding protein [Sulfitobacter sp.]
MNRILWTPTPERAEASTMAAFERFVGETRGLTFPDYNAMWEWSVKDLDAFWAAIWDFFGIRASVPYTRILGNRDMPGAQWCPDAMLNYADNILHHAEGREDHPAIVSFSETSGRHELTWGQLRRQVASVAAHLRRMGVEQGDRVVAVLPNTEAALIALLATASIGAAWSLCAPDMGQVAIVDRFKQIAPKVFISQDGYVHAGKT